MCQHWGFKVDRFGFSSCVYLYQLTHFQTCGCICQHFKCCCHVMHAIMVLHDIYDYSLTFPPQTRYMCIEILSTYVYYYSVHLASTVLHMCFSIAVGVACSAAGRPGTEARRIVPRMGLSGHKPYYILLNLIHFVCVAWPINSRVFLVNWSLCLTYIQWNKCTQSHHQNYINVVNQVCEILSL